MFLVVGGGMTTGKDAVRMNMFIGVCAKDFDPRCISRAIVVPGRRIKVIALVCMLYMSRRDHVCG